MNKTLYEHLQALLLAQFPNSVSPFTEQDTMMELFVQKEANLKVLTFLYENNILPFTFLTDLTAVHFPDKKGEELQVVYHLHNLEQKERLRVKVNLSIQQPELYTASALFAAANWMERETYDFFGVLFIGHPNLKRILNVEEMTYFPLRKEYALEDNTRLDKDDEMFGR